jgi:preprotein translocase SecF subunit
MGSRRIWIGISLGLAALSALSLMTRGLNLGIDFRGGTKVVVAFKGTEPVDREGIRQSVAAKFSELMQAGDVPQVEVQDFVAKATGNEVSRYVIYTEAVSLLTDAQKEAIAKSFSATFGEDTTITPPSEGGDQFFATFSAEAPIAERTKQMQGIFAANGVNRVVVTSDRVRDMNLEFFKESNLAQAEGDSPERMMEAIEAEEAFKARVAEFEKSGSDSSFTLRVEEVKTKMEEAIQGIPDLQARFLTVESSTSISPSVGSDLLQTALLAILYGCIGILIYLALRFDFKFGFGAVIALAHDPFITMGLMSVTQIPFTLPQVAVLLTIIGYSVNDTIVVYDRIRENLPRLKGMPFDRIANISVNETLSRTILTGVTTLFALAAIYVFGGGLISDFALTLLFGVVIGTYSSIFVATPVVLWLDGLTKKREAARLA